MRKPIRIALFAVVAAALAACAPAASAGWKTYTNMTPHYLISYPEGWRIDPNFVSVSLGPDHEIKGVAFVIPESLARGTNLSHNDTEISVESIPGTNCKPSQFLDPAEHIRTLQADGRTYTTASSGDAGAGNRYETMLFVVDGTSPCIAVRYFVHFTNIQNYDPGTIKEFDRAALINTFDKIRATLKINL